jgi:predicted RecB family nuclease
LADTYPAGSCAVNFISDRGRIGAALPVPSRQQLSEERSIVEVMDAWDEIPKLSKSRFLAGLQCHKRLYLECYAPDLSPAADPFTQSVLDTGTAVGALARERFPQGLLVSEDHLHHAEAEETTRRALADPAVPAIYEAAFTWGDVRIRADVLVRAADDLFDLVEVKSTTRPKLEHEWDLALQLAVLAGSGVRIRRAELMHLDRTYVHPGGAYDLARLFARVDLTETARALRGRVLRNLDRMRGILSSAEPPAIEVGPHCETPYACPFFERCHDGLPDDPLLQLPKAGRKLRARLAEAGIAYFDDIPLDFRGLSLHQRRALEAIRTGERFCDPAIREVLAGAAFPVHFIDFETITPALPLHPGTRPYDTLPVQWSDHVLRGDGTLDHHEYLDDGRADPRREFAESLLRTLGAEGTVVVYSGYEESRLADLAAWLPDLAGQISRVRARLLDLLSVIRSHVYDRAFNGSFSLKSVLPALVPAIGYDDLAIRDGGLASLAFLEMTAPGTSLERRAELRGQLLAYCGRDTEALVRLFQLLR